MTLFLVVIFQILLILICVAIVAISYKLPSNPVVYSDQLTLDNPAIIRDNNSIEIEKENEYE